MATCRKIESMQKDKDVTQSLEQLAKVDLFATFRDDVRGGEAYTAG